MLKHRILKINVCDIVLDPAAQSEVVTNACRRKSGMFVSGLCCVGDELILLLESLGEMSGLLGDEYVFAPFDSENVDDVVAEIGVRYFADFSLVGGFDIKRAHWALFRRAARE